MPIERFRRVALRLYGRSLRMLRVATDVPVFYFLWNDQDKLAACEQFGRDFVKAFAG